MEERHPLAAYCGNAKIRQSELAERIGISPSHLSLLIARKRQPSLDVAFRIERATGGAVPAASMLPGEVAA